MRHEKWQKVAGKEKVKKSQFLAFVNPHAPAEVWLGEKAHSWAGTLSLSLSLSSQGHARARVSVTHLPQQEALFGKTLRWMPCLLALAQRGRAGQGL